jgi:hypothetical protein
MKKKELLHLHSLLQALKRHTEAEYGVDEKAFAEYESLDIIPERVYERKGRHEEAVMTLSKVLVRELGGESDYSSDDEPQKVAPASSY